MKTAFAAACFVLAFPAAAVESAREADDLRAAFVAKAVCSGIYVNGRSQQDFVANDLKHVRPGLEGIRLTVDPARKRVTARFRDEVERTAVFHAGHGCTLLPRGVEDVYFKPVEIRPALPDPSTTAWPMGDREAEEVPTRVDRARLAAAVDLAFTENSSGPRVGTRALVAVYKGRILAERYAPGFDRRSVMISWSMGKSITAALVGILVGRGDLRLDGPAPVPEWQSPDSPRRAISLRHLLQMSSGLRFVRLDESDPDFFTSRNDHHRVYIDAIDAFQHAIRAEVEFPAATVGRYRNSDPLILGRIVREALERRGEDYFTFPQRALFDRIGARSMVLERDPWGNMILTGYDHGTARDWARFGLLHLQDGLWQGKRILPEGWVQFVSAPAPAWQNRNYGGLFWVNGDDLLAGVPREAFSAAGARGQRVVIVPSKDLVVVRMGYSLDERAYLDNLGRVVSGIIAAIDSR